MSTSERNTACKRKGRKVPLQATRVQREQAVIDCNKNQGGPQLRRLKAALGFLGIRIVILSWSRHEGSTVRTPKSLGDTSILLAACYNYENRRSDSKTNLVWKPLVHFFPWMQRNDFLSMYPSTRNETILSSKPEGFGLISSSF